mgnify:CR=1 FL=1
MFVIGIFELHAHHIGIEPFVRTFLVFAAFFVEYGARLRGKDGMLRQKLAQQRMQVALVESGFLRLGGRTAVFSGSGKAFRPETVCRRENSLGRLPCAVILPSGFFASTYNAAPTVAHGVLPMDGRPCSGL